MSEEAVIDALLTAAQNRQDHLDSWGAQNFSATDIDLSNVLRARKNALNVAMTGDRTTDAWQAAFDAVQLSDLLLRMLGVPWGVRRDGILYTIIKSNKTAQAAE